MKLLIAFLLCSTTAFSQIKCKFEKDEVDDFTKKLTRHTSFVTVGKAEGVSLQANMLRIDSTCALSFHFLSDIGCLSSKSKVILKFKDGELLTLSYRGKVDCGQYLTFYSIIREPLETFQAKEITKIRLQYDSYIDVDIKETWFVKDLLGCVGLLPK